MMNEKSVYVPFIQCDDIEDNDLLLITRPLSAEEFPRFFKLTHHVIDRWHHAVSNMAPQIYAEYHTHRGVLRDVETQFKIMMVDDGEKFIQTKSILAHQLTAVHLIFSSYGSAFQQNEDVCLFYYNIPSVLQRSFESLCGGVL
mgnify:FL=1|tara:strand:+ start:5694 stop:6122 length:429 start_codon:yes stop_codon:yes gene_type:complete